MASYYTTTHHINSCLPPDPPRHDMTWQVRIKFGVTLQCNVNCETLKILIAQVRFCSLGGDDKTRGPHTSYLILYLISKLCKYFFLYIICCLCLFPQCWLSGVVRDVDVDINVEQDLCQPPVSQCLECGLQHEGDDTQWPEYLYLYIKYPSELTKILTII